MSVKPRASTISCIDIRKSKYGSGEYVGMAMLPSTTSASDSRGSTEDKVDVKEEDIDDDEESMIELECPGDEKKKRCEA